jgi:hypothetical protein
MNGAATLSGLSSRFVGFFQKREAVELHPALSAAKRFPYGQFQMQIALTPGHQYQVEATTDLRHWTPIFSDVARARTVEYLDNSAANFSYRYYRVLSGELYSGNVIGYATLLIPPGFALIANPLHAPSNTVEALFPKMSSGTTLTKFETHLFKLTKNVFADGKWSNPTDSLLPGEGAILFNPTDDFKTFGMVGDVEQGDLSLPIPAGFSVRSSIVPLPGQLDTDLVFPVAENDVIHLFDRDRQRYLVYSFNAGKWSPEPPVLGVGESFWVGKTFAGNWTRTLVLNQLEEGSDVSIPALVV